MYLEIRLFNQLCRAHQRPATHVFLPKDSVDDDSFQEVFGEFFYEFLKQNPELRVKQAPPQTKKFIENLEEELETEEQIMKVMIAYEE